jgi:threonyl-tRNA synthetase
MPRITLPDGSVKEFDRPVTAGEVAASIGAGLAKAALGAKIDGELRDLSTRIEKDAKLGIVTAKAKGATAPDADALYLLRHSCAHVMAEAIQRLFPGVQLVYGPPLENSFYYDMLFPPPEKGGKAMSTEDFAKVEAEMAKIIAEDRPFTRYDMPMNDGPREAEGRGLEVQARQRRAGHRSWLDRTELTPPASRARTGKISAAARTCRAPGGSARSRSCRSPRLLARR